MKAFVLPTQGGGSRPVFPKVYRTPFEAADNVKLLQAKRAELHTEIGRSAIDPTNILLMNDLMENSEDRRVNRLQFAPFWQRLAVIEAQLQVATMEADLAYKTVGNVVLSNMVELPQQRG